MTVNTLGSYESRPSRTVAEWLWPFVPMGVAAFSLSALIYYHLWRNVFTVSSPLQQFYAWLYRVVGFAPAVMFFGLTILWSTIWLARGGVERPVARFLRLFAMMVMLGVFLNLGDGGVTPSPHTGVLGAWFAETLNSALGYLPSLFLVFAITLASVLLATDFAFYESFERMRQAPRSVDAGVEAAVADHLRGIAGVVPVTQAAPGASPAAASAAAMPEAPVAEESPLPEAPPAAEAPRRRTYAERRAERSWHRPSEEDWVPMPAPESQEIDNPESRDAVAATPVEAAALPEESPGAATAPHLEASTSPWPHPTEQRDELDASELRERDGEPVAETNALAEVGPRPPAVEDVEDVDDVVDVEEVEGVVDEEDDDDFAREDAVASAASESPIELSRVAPLVWPEETPATPPEVDSESIAEPPPEPAAEAPADEPLVAIPRPEAPVGRPSHVEPEVRQQDLFAPQVDEALVQEAIDVVTGARRASVSFLQRKLRIDYDMAAQLLAELAARGVIALEGDATQGRVLG